MKFKEALYIILMIGISISFLSFFGIRIFAEDEQPADYKSMITEVSNLLKSGDKDGAINLLEASVDKYPESNYKVLLNLSYLYLQQDNFDKMMDCYERGLERGFYFPIWIDADPWKSNYEKNERFKKIIEMNNAKLLEVNKESQPEFIIHKPENIEPDKRYPLLILLHGWNDNLPYFEKMWMTETLAKDYFVGILRSSQVIGWEAYGWDKQDIAERDIMSIYKDMISQYPIDVNNVMIGGFSQGGKTAMEAAFHQVIPVKGFIAHAPGGGLPIDLTTDLIKAAQDKGLEGFIFAGKKDHLASEQQKLEEFLIKNGYTGKFEWIDEMMHMYPKDFKSRLDNAIKSIIK